MAKHWSQYTVLREWEGLLLDEVAKLHGLTCGQQLVQMCLGESMAVLNRMTPERLHGKLDQAVPSYLGGREAAAESLKEIPIHRPLWESHGGLKEDPGPLPYLRLIGGIVGLLTAESQINGHDLGRAMRRLALYLADAHKGLYELLCPDLPH